MSRKAGNVCPLVQTLFKNSSCSTDRIAVDTCAEIAGAEEKAFSASQIHFSFSHIDFFFRILPSFRCTMSLLKILNAAVV